MAEGSQAERRPRPPRPPEEPDGGRAREAGSTPGLLIYSLCSSGPGLDSPGVKKTALEEMLGGRGLGGGHPLNQVREVGAARLFLRGSVKFPGAGVWEVTTMAVPWAFGSSPGSVAAGLPSLAQSFLLTPHSRPS